MSLNKLLLLSAFVAGAAYAETTDPYAYSAPSVTPPAPTDVPDYGYDLGSASQPSDYDYQPPSTTVSAASDYDLYGTDKYKTEATTPTPAAPAPTVSSDTIIGAEEEQKKIENGLVPSPAEASDYYADPSLDPIAAPTSGQIPDPVPTPIVSAPTVAAPSVITEPLPAAASAPGVLESQDVAPLPEEVKEETPEDAEQQDKEEDKGFIDKVAEFFGAKDEKIDDNSKDQKDAEMVKIIKSELPKVEALASQQAKQNDKLAADAEKYDEAVKALETHSNTVDALLQGAETPDQATLTNIVEETVRKITDVRNAHKELTATIESLQRAADQQMKNLEERETNLRATI